MPTRYMKRPSAPPGVCRAPGCTRRVGELNPRLRAYCSEPCKVDTDVRCGFNVLHHVWSRDRGRCASCGLDTERLAKVMRRLGDLWKQEPPSYQRRVVPFAPEYETVERTWRSRWDREVLRQLGFNQPDQSLWEADHIVPVVERPPGELPCGLDGFQTLCQPCHRAETAQLRKRMAKRRRCPICGRPKKRSRLTKKPCLCRLAGQEETA